MDSATRNQILDYIAEMKLAAKTPMQRQFSDDLAVQLLTQDCRPHVMAHGLHQWLGLTQPLEAIGAE